MKSAPSMVLFGIYASAGLPNRLSDMPVVIYMFRSKHIACKGIGTLF